MDFRHDNQYVCSPLLYTHAINDEVFNEICIAKNCHRDAFRYLYNRYTYIRGLKIYNYLDFFSRCFTRL